MMMLIICHHPPRHINGTLVRVFGLQRGLDYLHKKILKSATAKASAPQNIGRTALNESEDTWRFEWDQLVLQHPWLSVIQNDRFKKFALRHLPKDKTLGTRPLIESMEGTLRQLAQKEQDMREDGTYHVLGRDPIT